MPTVVDSTRQALLDAAREFVQTRGYNGFSFRDLAEQVGITTASIHYHFPTKAHLGRELVIRYCEAMLQVTRQIEARTDDPIERLSRFCDHLRTASKNGTRLCMCGMFGAEFATLPEMVQAEVRRLFESSESWIAGQLVRGRETGQIRFEGDPARAGAGVFAALQGGMLAACAFRDPARFDAAAECILANLTSTP
ncbi:MAG: TetR/AcrR family transcriptional regulator [Phycisphaerales bacterium]